MTEPFLIQVSDDAIADLHARLRAARWPDQLNDDNWSYGTELHYLKDLSNYWLHEFDWRAQERRLNAFGQYRVEIDGLHTHFIHQRSPHPQATPLILCHGWPGSIVEFLALIPRLTEPDKYGGSADNAFHVVAPSLPGFAWSDAAVAPGMNTRAIARRHVKLMQQLGYERYIAQGGDWGAWVTRHMADLDPEHCAAIHLNLVLAGPPPGESDPMADLSDTEKQALADNHAFTEDGMGYYQIQATRPQTLGYALADSPLGLCAWLTEKFRAWTDCDGDIRNAISWDDLLTNVSLYWFSNSIASSTRIYCEETRAPASLDRTTVPTGAAIYPRELLRPPRRWVEARYALAHWYEAERGGHFAAMEQPELFARDLWRFNATLQAQQGKQA